MDCSENAPRLVEQRLRATKAMLSPDAPVWGDLEHPPAKRSEFIKRGDETLVLLPAKEELLTVIGTCR